MAKNIWVTKEVNENGNFQRQKNKFTTPFGEGPDDLSVEAGRYRILWSPVCAWAHRSIYCKKTVRFRRCYKCWNVDQIKRKVERSDWSFTLDENDEDPVLKMNYISEAYLNADPEYTGRFTVPAVVDITTKKVVNNDYFNLTKYWELAWKKFHKANAPDLYPEELRDQIDELNDLLFHEINNGVYKAGFARSGSI